MLKITVSTIIVTRAILFIAWNNMLFQYQKIDNWHHMYTGAVLMLLSLIAPKKYSHLVLGVGLGLFIDELIHLFHLLKLTGATDYWSMKSIGTTIIGLLLVCVIDKLFAKKSVIVN